MIERSEASDFRELANIQYAVYFIIFSSPPKEVFYMFRIPVVISYSKDILSLLFITLNSLSYLLVASLAYPKEYFFSIANNSPLLSLSF